MSEELLFSDEGEAIEETLDKIREKEVRSECCDDKIRSLHEDKNDGVLILQPDFQRHYVWDKKKASSLIESALLNIPIPVVYLAEDEAGNKLVIDGQQRLTSFFNFIEGEFALSALTVYSELNGKYYKDLDASHKAKIRNCPIRTITFKKDSDAELKFNVFERLNTGAVALNDQELRNCIFSGEYNNLLKDLATDKDFRLLLGLSSPEKRMKDVQLVLRFAAFYHKTPYHYKGPIKKFLNEEMKEYLNISPEKAEELRKAFKNSVSLIKSLLGANAFRRFIPGTDKNPDGRWEPKIFNASLYDVLMFSFANRDKNLIMRNLDAIREGYLELMTTDVEFITAIEKSTSSSQAVNKRFSKWQIKLDEILSHDTHQPRCYSSEFKQELFAANPTCAICNQRISCIDDAAVDHIEQYHMGGTTTPENARLTHRYCNCARSRYDMPNS